MSSRLLITGGMGLIGSQVCEALVKQDVEFALVEQVESGMDLLEPGVWQSIVRRAEPQIVLHLAWKASGTKNYRSHPDNSRWVKKSREMIEYCQQSGIRFYGTGTVAELAMDAKDEYSQAKRTLWKCSEEEIKSGGISWIRPYYVFAPQSGRPALMREVNEALREGRTADIREPGVSHDFIHVEDVAAGIVLAIQHDVRGVIDVGSGQARSVAALVRAAGVKINDAVESEVATTESVVADTTVLRSLGWTPIHTNKFFGGKT